RRTGQVGAMLPHSRITHFPLTIRAATPSTLACFAASDFAEMLAFIPVLEQRLISTMADRVRETSQWDHHRERLAGLGKIAAGLAHELNNPAAAIQRAAVDLARSVAELADVAREGLEDGVGAQPVARIEALTTAGAVDTAPLDRLARSDAEEAVAASLARLGMAKPWTLAPGLVASGVRADALDQALDGVRPDAATRLVRWLHAKHAARTVQQELSAAAERVVDLVTSVKGFSQLDRAMVATDLDVREGIASTLAVLAHQVRGRRITLREEHAPSLPLVRGIAAELNQVWLNLIDNALDAAGEGGTVTVRTHARATEVLVDVEDDGPGIPADIVWRVFEPFFTTKPVGEGTGLGLERTRRVVMDHGGDVHVRSEPGRTVFHVRLPASVPSLPQG
ncbi:MAG TPA: ATP-binding protein, partial [Pseudomonadales bacterium]|nr:ATP-binding protein [Pseudomonadales bacterium]